MEPLAIVKKYLSSIKKQFDGLSPNNKIFIIIGVAAVIGVGLASMFWAFSSDYKNLYTNLDLVAAGDITTKLDEYKISYKVSQDGTTIQVPEEAVYDARMKLASDGFPNSKHIGFEIFDETNLGMTDFVQKVNFRRALEGELARSIQELESVDEARVHLVIPERRLFAMDQKDPSASIMLKLSTSNSLSKAKIQGMVHLVASSVEGLTDDNITIVDQFSNLLAPNKDENSIVMESAKQIQIQRNVEDYLENKAKSMLDDVLGKDNSIVKVSIELDFDQVQRTIESYDPEMTAIRSQEQIEESNPVASGSTEENRQTAENAVASAKTVTTNYEVSKTIESIIGDIGNIKRMSVAVTVDGTYLPAGEGEEADEFGMKYIPRTTQEMESLGNIVKHAVGYSSERNDQFKIENLKFDNTDEQMRLVKEKNLEMRRNLNMYISYGVKLLLAVALIFFGRKYYLRYKMRQKERKEQHEKMLQEEDAASLSKELKKPKLIDQIIVAANESPEEMARVIKTILSEE
ncbi:MAG: flagellar M-ring protein FliF [candidate division Zixibacteria bacterium]|nr:flagellar M-ring protein FliF [candidate division Zixibacteria bacterium]